MSKKRVWIAAVFLSGLLAFAFYFGSLALFAFSPAKEQAGNQPSDLIIEVYKNENPWELSKKLESQGITTSASSFHRLGRIMRLWQKVKTGEYKVSAQQNPLQLFAVITSGISLAHPITIREGENSYDIGDDLEARKLLTKKAFLQFIHNPKHIQDLLRLDEASAKKIPSLEGYLFPDTYFFNKTMTGDDMVRQMVKRFLTRWTPQDDARAKELGLNRHELITLASIVEKETGAAQERPIIASVFYNRLHKRMRLQSDPTTIYGIWERYHGNIHKSDLLQHTPYNTYTVDALPIGPIGNPGREAIDATLHPAQSDYLFFVSHNDGTHEFTTNIKDHNQAVKDFQLNKKAREGKSWRDLLKKQAH